MDSIGRKHNQIPAFTYRSVMWRGIKVLPKAEDKARGAQISKSYRASSKAMMVPMDGDRPLAKQYVGGSCTSAPYVKDWQRRR